jgi:hypothetical protein
MRFACSVAVCVVAVFTSLGRGQDQVPARPGSAPPLSALERFLAAVDDGPISYRARRVLSARAGDRHASLVAKTSFDSQAGFSFEVMSEAGSSVIRSRVLRGALEAEQRAKMRSHGAGSALNSSNYTFEPAVDGRDGLQRVRIRPRRKDAMMVDGTITLVGSDGDLVSVEGSLVKRPSFWTRRVEIERRYARVAGVRVPVSMTSVADVLFVGRSTFEMQYDYEFVNGKPVAAASGEPSSKN